MAYTDIDDPSAYFQTTLYSGTGSSQAVTNATDTTHYKMNFGNPAYAISSGNTDGDGFGNFEFAVPSNYFSWCTKNLAEYG